MLLAMKMEDGLKQGSVMDIAKRFNVACSMIYRLWECAECTHAMGVINSPELILQGGNSGRVPKYLTEFIHEGVKNLPLRKRHTQ